MNWSYDQTNHNIWLLWGELHKQAKFKKQKDSDTAYFILFTNALSKYMIRLCIYRHL